MHIAAGLQNGQIPVATDTAILRVENVAVHMLACGTYVIIR
jgi:hypothetical protein